MAQFSVNIQPQRFDPYKNFKFRDQMGRAIRGRDQQMRLAQAHDGSRQTSRRRRSQQHAQIAGPHRV